MTVDKIKVETVTEHNCAPVLAFANQKPLMRNDLHSAVNNLTAGNGPIVRSAVDSATQQVVGTMIDDGLAVVVDGDEAGVKALRATMPDLSNTLVVAGPLEAVQNFVGQDESSREIRTELVMAITATQFKVPVEHVPIRVAETADIPILATGRAAAIEEEYGIRLDRHSTVFADLVGALERAVEMRGVAIWIESDYIAFTAQLIAMTPSAATFGDLYTAPEMRGQGRATRGLASFCSWLLTESEHVTLRVGSENEPAVRLYERVGFKVVDQCASSLQRNAFG